MIGEETHATVIVVQLQMTSTFRIDMEGLKGKEVTNSHDTMHWQRTCVRSEADL